MGMSRSTYYYKPKSNLEKLKADADLRDAIERILLEFGFYGIRRVTEELARRGQPVNHKRVERIMKKAGWCAKKKKKRFHRTTDSNHPYPIYPNLVQDFKPTAINQLWVADITYIRIQTAFVYLAAILDAFSRKVVGYAISKHIDEELTLSALRSAIELRQPPADCIHHSDRGSQYAAGDYVKLLKQHGFQISMSRKGNCYDNAMAESFFKTLKTEEVYVWEYRTWEEVIARIPEFIELVYNRKRLHSSLGYLPPAEFEEKQKAALDLAVSRGTLVS
jgi:transposase InsO family protein